MLTVYVGGCDVISVFPETAPPHTPESEILPLPLLTFGL